MDFEALQATSAHGTGARYRSGCRCGACREAQAERIRGQRARRREERLPVSPGPAPAKTGEPEPDEGYEARGWGAESEPERASSGDLLTLAEIAAVLFASWSGRRKGASPPSLATTPRVDAPTLPVRASPAPLAPLASAQTVLLDCGHRVRIDTGWRGHRVACRTCGVLARVVPEG